MRFGKKLALAMIRDAGEAPYMSQKPLKHILVGLEKLGKLYTEQALIIAEGRTSPSELLAYINAERVKYGLTYRDQILDIFEVIDRDVEFFKMLRNDVIRLRRYVEGCEADLMECINEWLEGTSSDRLTEESHLNSTEASTCRTPDEESSDAAAVEILNEFSRLKQYTDVNASAINKLIARRNKNVAECFWSVDSFPEVSSILTDESRDLAAVVELIARLSKHPLGITPAVTSSSTPSISL